MQGGNRETVSEEMVFELNYMGWVEVNWAKKKEKAYELATNFRD